MAGGIAEAELSDLLVALAHAHHVPGAQFALCHDGQRVAVATGEAEYGTGRPVTADLAFPIGSITKAFTATLAMILVADGDLELDVPIGELVPEVRGGPAAVITLRQLLSHTGGLDSGSAGAGSVRKLITQARLILPPGQAFSYSNTGYVLAGRLIETVTGMSWWQAIESILLRPLGIPPAFVSSPEPAERVVAAGHSVNADGRTRPVVQDITLAEAFAGALAVSATDLVTFGLMHVNGSPVLPAEYVREMREQVVDVFGLADGWGLGLARYDGWAGHDGTGDGTWCHLRFDPGSGTVAALTSNGSTGAGLWNDLVHELGRRGLPIPSGALMDVPEQTEPYPPGCVGRYLSGDTEYSIDARLRLSIDGEPVATIAFHEGLTFSLRDTRTGQTLYAGRCLASPETGAIDRIQINGRLARRT
ncbi:CubicO group peptidase (beta-lactamase class C family) [Kibdelosporangium banguiense]|uniref:CubicO group peptidase (Beta-lactamase class C family) n=1 Tax=Kibdelosporangium banguiense TaxID=1365924 RepID=A0ABS4T5Z9_9PSEU|nr:serine hydrolase domain-containing protein [Kibdelosporangium banguiense]MBP2319887.1 CubicO group peptidase (beta-lactamase class C family) [Kibdelosporangium banguiense]